MYCCPNCFNDWFLETHIYSNQIDIGNCDYCKSSDVPIIEANQLAYYFEFVMSIYIIDETATSNNSISSLLQRDWDLFTIDDINIVDTLLKDITQDENVLTKSYSSCETATALPIQEWSIFRKEILSENRYILKHSLDLKKLESLFFQLTYCIDAGHTLYRARIQSTEEAFGLNDMGMPPSEYVKSGRANPIGIPYLYTATSVDTAICEKRPHPGDYVSVATLRSTEYLRLVNLLEPQGTISPFNFDDEDDLCFVRDHISFLTHLAKELSKPVHPRLADTEYIPTQYLCEFAKSCDYDGVIFWSSVSDGHNITLFSESKTEITDVSRHRICGLNYEHTLEP